ncbi:hypothetical protein B0T24DRAFT_332539 [Lasiosphaeria ovina]|uniref:Uncharacterized protein n=1 Tax=Lasiosphaeria ovina TaxID=92902 RepID=A0AAE0K7U0_9PEZI|nr:hypothetical protein B0T24DRAFT_332539 [Lasiosphaeria ovina]
MLIEKRCGPGKLWTFENNGVQFLTDTVVNPQGIGLDGQQLTEERGQDKGSPDDSPQRGEKGIGVSSFMMASGPLLSPPGWQHDTHLQALSSAGWPREPVAEVSVNVKEYFSPPQPTVRRLSLDPARSARDLSPLQLLANVAGRSQSAAQLMHPPIVVSASDPAMPAATERDVQLINGSGNATQHSFPDQTPTRLGMEGQLEVMQPTRNSRPGGAGNSSLPGWTYFPTGYFEVNSGDVSWVGDIRVGPSIGIPVPPPSDITHEVSTISSELSLLDQIMPVANHSGDKYISGPVYRTNDFTNIADGLEITFFSF